MSSETPNPASLWDAGHYAAHAAFVPALGAPVLELLAPQPGERILDLGCGDGVLTEKLVAAGASVLGVDYSEPMLDSARSRGLDVQQANGEALTFNAEFDAVFSNAALHWMLDGAAVAAGVFRALKPGGRFICLEFSRPTTGALRKAYDAWSFHAIPRIGGWVAKDRDSYQYLVESIRRFPDQQTFKRMIEEAGFSRVSVTNLSGGIAAIHHGWAI